MRTGLAGLAALYVLVQWACAPASSRAAPFVGCAADGQQGHIAPPKGQPKAVDSSNVFVEGIAYYKGDYAPGVFAPSGWRCHVWYGSSGSVVLVTPTAIDTTHSSPAHVLGPAVELSAHFGGTSGRFSVAEYGARLFPAQLTKFIARVKSEGLVPDSEFNPRHFAHDSVTPLSSLIAAFTTPPGLSGIGTAWSLDPSPDPIRGVAVLAGDSTEPDLAIFRVRLGATQQDLEAILLELNRRCMQAGEPCWGSW
jgi:hypothetical protein